MAKIGYIMAAAHCDKVAEDTQMDLGIAKYHFEIGAGTDTFDWV